MFLKETLLLTCAVVTCKIMDTFSVNEPIQNQTTQPSPASIKPLHVELSSTVVNRSTHQHIDVRQDGGIVNRSTHQHIDVRQDGGIVNRSTHQHIDVRQDAGIIKRSTHEHIDVRQDAGIVKRAAHQHYDDRQDAGIVKRWTHEHIDVRQDAGIITNVSEISPVGRSLPAQGFRDSSSNHTQETHSESTSALSVDVYTLSNVNETRGCYNSSTCLAKANSNITYAITNSLEKSDGDSNSRGDNVVNADLDVINTSRGDNVVNTSRGDNVVNADLDVINTSRGDNVVNTSRGDNVVNADLDVINTSMGDNVVNADLDVINTSRGDNVVNTSRGDNVVNTSRGDNVVNADLDVINTSRGDNVVNADLDVINTSRGDNVVTTDPDVISNSTGDNEVNTDPYVMGDSSVHTRHTILSTPSPERFSQTTSYRQGRNPTMPAHATPSNNPASSQLQSESDSEVILEFGGEIFAVCQPDMLCRDRCPHPTDATSTGRETTSSSDIKPDTMKNFQQATYSYDESTSVETLQRSMDGRHRRFARVNKGGSHARFNKGGSHARFNKGGSHARFNKGGSHARFNKGGSHARKQRDYRIPEYDPRKSLETIRGSAGKRRVKRGFGDAKETLSRCRDFNNATCFCDVVCVLYGDCCPDVFASCFLLNTTEDMLKYISSVWRRHLGSRPADYTKGTSLTTDHFLVEFASCQRIGITTGMLLVSQCPADIRDNSLKENCENPSEVLFPPVTGRFQDGDVAFRNIFCARCHGVKDTDVLVWTTQYFCGKNISGVSSKSVTISDLRELVWTGVCETSFVAPEDTCEPRQCETYAHLSEEQKVVLERNVQERICSEAEAILCQSYYYPKVGFANAHCRTCLRSELRRRRDVREAACDIQFYSNRQQNKLLSESISGGILLILDVTGTFGNGDGTRNTYICNDEEVFDPMVLACTSLICPAGFRPYRGRCRDVPGQYFTDGSSQIFPGGWSQLVATIETGNDTCLPCEVSISIQSSNNDTLREHNIKRFQSLDFKDRDSVSVSASPQCNTFTAHKDELRDIITNMLTSIFTSNPVMIDQTPTLPTELDSLQLFNDTYQIDISNINSSTVTSYRCPSNNILHQVWNFSLVEKNSTVYVLVNTSHREIYYPLRNVGFQVTLSHNPDTSVTWVLNQSVYVCDPWLSPRDNCTVVKYKLNDTLQNGSRLMILSSGVYYDNGDFELTGDEVFVCTNFSFPYEPNNLDAHQSLAYLVLSWLLTIISIIFLFLMLVLYCLFPELCTLPGRMTASLAAAMMLTFLSNLFTLVELHHDYICPLAAALSHVVTLAHFGWMSAIAINMALTFGPLRNSLVRTVSDRTLFFRYNLVVWGSSIVLVMTSVILDLTHREANTTSETATVKFGESKYPRYGYPYCTWFSGPMWTKLVFVMIPYLITFVVSLVGFLVALIGIQQASKSAKKLGKKSSVKTRCMIYLKLATAMGFNWVTSAVSNIYPNSVVLPYVCLCLVLLQGVLLFLAFMANHRVYRLLVRKFTTKRDDSSNSGTTNTSLVMTLSA